MFKVFPATSPMTVLFTFFTINELVYYLETTLVTVTALLLPASSVAVTLIFVPALSLLLQNL